MKKLNFSCGDDIREGWDNCDWQQTKDKRVILCNANKFPFPFIDNTYDIILLKQCLNFYEDPRKVLLELWRIAKNNAVISIEVPYYNNKGAYTDIDSKRFFHDQTFITFVENNCRIDKTPKFEIELLYLQPTPLGRLFTSLFRKKLSVFIGGLIGKVFVRLKVIK